MTERRLRVIQGGKDDLLDWLDLIGVELYDTMAKKLAGGQRLNDQEADELLFLIGQQLPRIREQNRESLAVLDELLRGLSQGAEGGDRP